MTQAPREGMEFEDAVAGILSAQKFLLEQLYALHLAQNPDPITACKASAAEHLRQFGELPTSNPDEVHGDAAYAITQHGLHHLERFWDGVEQRLRNHAANKGRRRPRR